MHHHHHHHRQVDRHAERLATLDFLYSPVLLHGLVAAIAGGALGFLATRFAGVRWSWPLIGLTGAALAWVVDRSAGIVLGVGCVAGAAMSVGTEVRMRRAGGDLAAGLRRRSGPLAVARRTLAGRIVGRAVSKEGMLVGRDEWHLPVRVPLGARVTHTLVLGATGAGKTVTQAWILGRAIDAGLGAICVDPKGDGLLLTELHAAARRNDRRFALWTPQGPTSYNPFAHGSGSELADKALAGETYSEPHYLRQAQRYVAHATRALHAARRPVTLGALVATLEPDELEKIARPLPDEYSAGLLSYLDSLTAEQRRGLAGTRDRLAILAESEMGMWLGDQDDGIDLRSEIEQGAVVYFRLDADRWPLLAEMLAAAIVQDLITVAAARQGSSTRAVVCIDEFSAIAPQHVVRLFGRARSAGLSLLLGTQEIADLASDDHPRLLQQVLGNAATIVAHRQRVPDSAELLAKIAGTRGSWTHTQRTHGLGLGREEGTRTRAREFHVHPDDFKTLGAGEAVVITDDGRTPRRARMLHPRQAGARP